MENIEGHSCTLVDRDNSVGIETRYGLHDPGIESLVAERSKAKVCCRSLAGVAGSNPGGGMEVCVVCRK